MRCYNLFLLLLVVGVIALVAAPTLSSTVLFQDDFESGTAGSAPTGGAPGNWQVWLADGHFSVVNDAAPGPASGANYLYLGRGNTSGWVEGDAFFANQAANGTTVRLDFDINSLSTNWPLTFYGAEQDHPNSSTLWKEVYQIVLNPNGVVADWTQGGAAVPLAGMQWKNNQWQHCEVDYTIGSGKFDITYDGVTKTGLAIAPGGHDINCIVFAPGVGAAGDIGLQYFDNVTVTIGVPEPSSIALLVSALVGLVAYAWRKRK
jgi:hypothetical protein